MFHVHPKGEGSGLLVSKALGRSFYFHMAPPPRHLTGIRHKRRSESPASRYFIPDQQAPAGEAATGKGFTFSSEFVLSSPSLLNMLFQHRMSITYGHFGQKQLETNFEAKRVQFRWNLAARKGAESGVELPQDPCSYRNSHLLGEWPPGMATT